MVARAVHHPCIIHDPDLQTHTRWEMEALKGSRGRVKEGEAMSHTNAHLPHWLRLLPEEVVRGEPRKLCRPQEVAVVGPEAFQGGETADLLKLLLPVLNQGSTNCRFLKKISLKVTVGQ